MRVYKRKSFARFQRRERIDDDALAKAVRDIEAGVVDADLGGGLVKQRVARRGQGKRGGYRTILAFLSGSRAVFLYGFAKSDRDNIDAGELDQLRNQGRTWLRLSEDLIEEAIAESELQEVAYDSDEEER